MEKYLAERLLVTSADYVIMSTSGISSTLIFIG